MGFPGFKGFIVLGFTGNNALWGFARTFEPTVVTQATFDPRTARIHQHGLHTTFVIQS